MASPARPFSMRHVQFVRALLAAGAALMITFSPDHSAGVGLGVFSGFAVATGLVFGLAAWLVAAPGRRGAFSLLAAISLVAGLLGGLPPLRTDTGFFVIVGAWALLSGLVELVAGILARKRSEAGARDVIITGALGLLLVVALLLVPINYSWGYSIEGAGDFTLTGIILGVGMLGAYCAIVAVFLAIAGFSPRVLTTTAPETPADAPENEVTA